MSQKSKSAVHFADMPSNRREKFCKVNNSVFPHSFGHVLFAVLEYRNSDFVPHARHNSQLIPKLPNNVAAAAGVKPDIYKNFKSYIIPLHHKALMQ